MGCSLCQYQFWQLVAVLVVHVVVGVVMARHPLHVADVEVLAGRVVPFLIDHGSLGCNVGAAIWLGNWAALLCYQEGSALIDSSIDHQMLC